MVLLIIGIAAYFSYFSSEDTSKTDATIKTVEQIRIEDEKIMIEKQLRIEQEQNRIERQFSAWDGRHIKLYQFIKENLNDPDSLQHIETRYWKNFDENGQFNNTITVKTKYRAKNSFGGYVVEYISADCDMDGNIIKINSPTD